MRKERLRAGVVGTGLWTEQTHLPGLRSRPDVDVVALCGRNGARLAELGDRFGVPGRHADWRAMLAAERLDVLLVATPNVLHHPVALDALRAGVHVVSEKPLAMDVRQARELAAEAEARGLQTLTFFTHRAVSAAAMVKRLVAQGFLGRLHHVHAAYLTTSHLKPGKPAAWRMRRAEAGTGVLGDLGSHLVDLVQWWAGDLTAVAGQWQRRDRTWPGGGVADADEAVSWLARLAGGAQASFQASKLVAGRGNFQRVELCGEAGSLVYEADPGVAADGWTGRLLAGRPGGTALEPVPLPHDLTAGLDQPEPAGRAAAWRRLADPFLDAVKAGPGAAAGPDTPGFRQGARVQAVLDAVAASAEGAGWVEVA